MLNRFRRITSDTWFALGLEFFAIVVGVLFALTVDEWREERQIEAMNAMAVTRLNEEILRNHQELVQNIAVIKDRHARLTAMQVENGIPFIDLIPEFKGHAFPDLKKPVWQRLDNNPFANRMNPDYLDAATELYLYNHLLDQLSAEIFRLSMNEAFHDPAQAELAWRMSGTLMRQQLQWEREALALYENFIRRFIDPAKTE